MRICRSSVSHASGFTLIELLVVVLIVGLGVSLVAFSISAENPAAALRHEARTFANQSALIAEEAVVAGQQWGIDLYRLDEGDGEQIAYRWLLQDPDDPALRWVPAVPQGMDFSGAVFSPDTQVTLTVDGIDRDITTRQDPKPPADPDADEDSGDAEDKNSESLVPDVLLLSSSEVSSFALTLVREDDERYEQVVKADALGRFQLQDDTDEAQ